MVAGLAIRDPTPGGRPLITRSRSHTIPPSTAAQEGEGAPELNNGPRSPPRPSTRGRSHSYLSPVDPSPRAAHTLPADPPSKHHHTLRLPGSHREHRHSLRHRHTQSEAKNTRYDSTENLSHLVARLQKERKEAGHLSRQSTSTSTSTWQSHVNNLVRIASTDPYRPMSHPMGGPIIDNTIPNAFGAANYRSLGIDGAHSRQPTTKQQTFIELAIDRASAKRELERFHPNPSEVERRQAALDRAQAELRERLADLGRQSGDIGRRLEYTYYSLLEKASSLIGTISSFQSLSEQSGQLIENFDSETAKLDIDTRRRIAKLRDGFDDRESRVKDLQDRSIQAGAKARELQTRLGNARTMVENWEKREEAAAKKWLRVWGGMFWTSVVLLALILAVLLWKEGWFYGDPVQAGLKAGSKMPLPPMVRMEAQNHSIESPHHAESVGTMQLPDEVRSLLEGIEARRLGKGSKDKLKIFPGRPERLDVREDEKTEKRREKVLRRLDEL